MLVAVGSPWKELRVEYSTIHGRTIPQESGGKKPTKSLDLFSLERSRMMGQLIVPYSWGGVEGQALISFLWWPVVVLEGMTWNCDRGGSGWISGRMWSGARTDSPGQWSQHQACQNSRFWPVFLVIWSEFLGGACLEPVVGFSDMYGTLPTWNILFSTSLFPVLSVNAPKLDSPCCRCICTLPLAVISLKTLLLFSFSVSWDTFQMILQLWAHHFSLDFYFLFFFPWKLWCSLSPPLQWKNEQYPFLFWYPSWQNTHCFFSVTNFRMTALPSGTVETTGPFVFAIFSCHWNMIFPSLFGHSSASHPLGCV